jgi:hypothetical protein
MVCGIFLPFLRLVNGISKGPIGTTAAQTVGIILIWPANAKVVRVCPQGCGPLYRLDSA